MRDFTDKVVVVTGAAGGIGWALAETAARRGAKLVIADIRAEPLAEAAAKLKKLQTEVLAIRTDVSSFDDVQAMADAAFNRFGNVNLLFNNAGVFASGLTWEISLQEYDWVIGVNLKSVIHGIKAFVPRMIAQADECHVVNIASGAGIVVTPGTASYSMTKHGVVALSEALWLDLVAEGIGNIGVTVVMPGAVQSKIMFPEKTAPAMLMPELATRQNVKTLHALETWMRKGVDAGLPAPAVADMVYQAIKDNALYVLPNFDDDDSRAIAQATALGRCTGINPYPQLLETMAARFE